MYNKVRKIFCLKNQNLVGPTKQFCWCLKLFGCNQIFVRIIFWFFRPNCFVVLIKSCRNQMVVISKCLTELLSCRNQILIGISKCLIKQFCWPNQIFG